MAQIYQFGEVEVRCAERRVLVSGHPVSVGARGFDLLLALIERRGRVVTKEELLNEVWPGLVVEEANIQVQVSALRKAIGSNVVATVHGRGYRFVAALAMDEEKPRSSGELSRTTESSDGSPLPDKPSIAVVPFANLSAEGENVYFSDGVTEDIITQLSRFHSLFVVSQASTSGYRNKEANVEVTGRELGVRYVLNGSIRRQANRVRVTAQLVDAATQTYIWAESYDGLLEEVFVVQEDLARRIVTTIAPEIATAEMTKARRRRPSNLSAYELAVQASAECRDIYRTSGTSRIDSAVGLAERALSIDPHSTLALNTLSLCRWLSLFFRTAPDPRAAWVDGLSSASHAIDVDPTDSAGYVAKALLLSHAPPYDARGPQYDEALSNLQIAHRLNPNDSFALSMLGFTEALAGEPLTGITHLKDALRLNPRDLSSANVLGMLSMAHFLAEKYQDGVDWGIQAVSKNSQMPNLQLFLALNYVGTGLLEEARHALSRARDLSSEYVDARVEGFSLYRMQEHRTRQTEFLRIASSLVRPRTMEAGPTASSETGSLR